MNQKRDSQFIFVVGPTCSGKSSLAMSLALQGNLPIINCDSLQFFQEVNIGTAKPSLEERSQVKHFLFDNVPLGEPYGLGSYLEDIQKLFLNGGPSRAVFCGGSGFYIQALEKGVYDTGTPSAALKLKVEQWLGENGFQKGLAFVVEKDPEYGQKLNINDKYRIQRALEILFENKKSISSLKKDLAAKSRSPLPSHKKIKIGIQLDRERLRNRVEQRTRQMLHDGFVTEVESILQKGAVDWAPLKSVGYREVVNFLKNPHSEEVLIEKIVTSTMQLAKKQRTWFQRDTEIRWYQEDQVFVAVKESLEWLESVGV